MTYEQQFSAIKALSNSCPGPALHMREPGNWYLYVPCVEIGGNGLLKGVGKSGITPEYAVEHTWDELTSVVAPFFIVINAMQDDQRRQVRWNGFMWADVQS